MSYLIRESLAPINVADQQRVREHLYQQIDNQQRLAFMFGAMLKVLTAGPIPKKLSREYFAAAEAMVDAQTPATPVSISASATVSGSEERTINFSYREKYSRYGSEHTSIDSRSINVDKPLKDVPAFIEKMKYEVSRYEASAAALEAELLAADANFKAYNDLAEQCKALAEKMAMPTVGSTTRYAMPLLKLLPTK